MFAFDGSSFVWNDNLYKSDIVMSAIRPYANAMGKTVAKHIQETVKPDGSREIKVNPEPYIRFLLEEPNPLMSWQKFAEWMAICEKINNHAFSVIQRDENGFPVAMYPINATMATAEYDAAGRLYIKFYTYKGEIFKFAYSDLYHLRGDMTGTDFWGGSKAEQLLPLMEKLDTIDRGIINAIKNSAAIKWLLKCVTPQRPDELKKKASEFAEQFLNSSTSFGVAAVDTKVEAEQLKPTDFVPNAAHTDRTVKRLYAALNTNEKIVTSRPSRPWMPTAWIGTPPSIWRSRGRSLPRRTSWGIWKRHPVGPMRRCPKSGPPPTRWLPAPTRLPRPQSG